MYIKYSICIDLNILDHDDLYSLLPTPIGIVLLVGNSYAVYTRRVSILVGALILGSIFGIMAYRNSSNYCKQTLVKELMQCEEKWL